jgi:hypothetical protein
MYRGAIVLTWEFPTYDDGDIVDLQTVKYHVLSSVGNCDFPSALTNATQEELVLEFQQKSLNADSIQYHSVPGEERDVTVNTTYAGEIHTLIVIAEADGVFSSNTEATKLYASSTNPVPKVNVTQIFIPTEKLNITVSQKNKLLTFDGSIRPEHRNLTSGDYVYGITSKRRIFYLLVVKQINSTDSTVNLSTKEALVNDVFSSLDYDTSVSMSRPNKVKYSPSSRLRYRHLMQRHSRRLGFLSSIFDWIDVNVVQPIGDALSDAVEPFRALWDLVTKGEAEKTFPLVDFDQSIDIPFDVDGKEITDDIKLDIAAQ